MIRQHNQYRFYKENEGWYIDLPEYIEAGGLYEDLAMVLGADDLLDHLTKDGDEIFLELGVDKKGEYYWDYIEKCKNNPPGSGATYVYTTGVEMFVCWLCPVTIFLFDEYPEIIYFKKIDKSIIK